MLFRYTLYFALAIFIAGVAYRIFAWFRLTIGADATGLTFSNRTGAAVRGLWRVLFSTRILKLLLAVILDVLFQKKLFKSSRLRWLMHYSIFLGFSLLIVMHALDSLITQSVFSDYASTLSPFLFLRNLFGVMVLLGVGIAIYRRVTVKPLRAITNASDKFALFMLLFILLSGFVLESVQIQSESIFSEMAEDYFIPSEDNDLEGLKAYWAKDFGVSFSTPVPLGNSDLLERGRQIHAESCATCHSRPDQAFLSYPISVAIRPFSVFLDRNRADIGLWYVHFLACFVALAYLPFSRFFHLITTPISLLVTALSSEIGMSHANKVTARVLGTDACTHCGQCSLHCSVAPIYQLIPNTAILPSEKLKFLRRLAGHPESAAPAFETLSEGSFICTECFRCTQICPAGINLQDLWLSSKSELRLKGFPEPHLWISCHNTGKWAELIQMRSELQKPPPLLPSGHSDLFFHPGAYTSCIQCTTCTSVCPVIASSEIPARELDFTPHEIMNLLRLGSRDLALGSWMVWNCVTCYMCQENCPQGIKVADVLYELRNLAWQRIKPIRMLPDSSSAAPAATGK